MDTEPPPRSKHVKETIPSKSQHAKGDNVPSKSQHTTGVNIPSKTKLCVFSLLCFFLLAMPLLSSRQFFPSNADTMVASNADTMVASNADTMVPSNADTMASSAKEASLIRGFWKEISERGGKRASNEGTELSTVRVRAGAVPLKRSPSIDLTVPGQPASTEGGASEKDGVEHDGDSLKAAQDQDPSPQFPKFKFKTSTRKSGEKVAVRSGNIRTIQPQNNLKLREGDISTSGRDFLDVHLPRNATLSMAGKWLPLDKNSPDMFVYAAYFDDVENVPFVRLLLSVFMTATRFDVVCLYYRPRNRELRLVGHTEGYCSSFAKETLRYVQINPQDFLVFSYHVS